jgi:hypothetical protein
MFEAVISICAMELLFSTLRVVNIPKEKQKRDSKNLTNADKMKPRQQMGQPIMIIKRQEPFAHVIPSRHLSHVVNYLTITIICTGQRQ